jgi:phosphopantetheine adenylyltransferase
VNSSRTVSEIGSGSKGVSVRLGPTLTINYVEMSDHNGLATTDESLSALVISRSDAGAKAFNSKREEKGWRPLEVFEVDRVSA